MISIDKIAYTNKLLKMNPSGKIFFSLFTMINCFIFNNIYISFFVILLMYMLLIYIVKIKRKTYFKMMSIPLIFLIIGVITIILGIKSPQKEYIFTFKILSLNFGIEQAAIKLAIKIFLKSLACTSCLYFLILTTPVLDVIYFLEVCKIPRFITEIMGLVYRYIFILLDAAQMIYTSQSSRLGYYKIKNSFLSFGKLISSLFLISLRQANENFIAMEARCYDGEIKFQRMKYVSSKRMFLLTFIVNILIIFLFYCKNFKGNL